VWIRINDFSVLTSEAKNFPDQKNIYDYGGGKNEGNFDLQFCFHWIVSGIYKEK
jgi:hypothetical protein